MEACGSLSSIVHGVGKSYNVREGILDDFPSVSIIASLVSNE